MSNVYIMNYVQFVGMPRLVGCHAQHANTAFEVNRGVFCVCTHVYMHACLLYDLRREAHFDGRSYCFQNKRASGPPAKKKLRIDEMKKGGNWRNGSGVPGGSDGFLLTRSTAAEHQKAATPSSTAWTLH